MNKTTLVSGVVIVALISVITAIFTSGSEDTIESSSRVSDKKPEPSTQAVSQKEQSQDSKSKSDSTPVVVKKSSPTTKSSKSEASKQKVVAKPSSKTTVAQTQTDSKTTRVRWPGMKYRSVRFVHEERIEPATELRTWSRKQWVTKVQDLRQADKDDLAEKYIAAYNKQYPNKDLNDYLK